MGVAYYLVSHPDLNRGVIRVVAMEMECTVNRM